MKVVPVGAGLGGGSSDAAAVLLSLRQLTEIKCDDDKLAELAGRLGSDIPFFIYTTPAFCKGRGEIIEPVTLKESYRGLLVHPGFGVSTPWAYKTYAQNPQAGDGGTHAGRFYVAQRSGAACLREISMVARQPRPGSRNNPTFSTP